MRKVFNVFHNEIIKALKKRGLLIITIVMFGLIVVVSFFVKLADISDTDDYTYYTTNYEDEIEWYTSEIPKIQTLIDRYEIEENTEEVLNQKYTLAEYKNQLFYNQKCKEFHSAYSSYFDSYEYEIIADIIDKMCYENLLRVYAELGLSEYTDEELEAECKKYADEYKLLQTFLLEDDPYVKYVEYENLKISQNENYDDELKQLMIEINNYKLKIEYKNDETPEQIEEVMNRLERYDREISTRLDSYGDYLPQETIDRYILEREVAIKHLEEGTLDVYYDGYSIRYICVQICSVVVLLFAMVAAIIHGSTLMSSEFSTGSIKSLIIAPVKRWKIYVAKLLSIVAITSVIFIAGTLFTEIMSSIFFGFKGADSFVYVFAGKVHSMPYVLYIICKMLLDYIAILAVGMFAYMLSVFTKKTGVALPVSLVILFLGLYTNMIMGLVTLGGFNNLKTLFNPFYNLALSSNIFDVSYSSEMVYSTDFSYVLFGISENSVWFSVLYNVALFVTMFLVGYDSFCKRDIK